MKATILIVTVTIMIAKLTQITNMMTQTMSMTIGWITTGEMTTGEDVPATRQSRSLIGSLTLFMR